MIDHINKKKSVKKRATWIRNQKSLTGAVLIFTETVIGNHENGNNTAAIFLDLAKAFNSNSQKIFL